MDKNVPAYMYIRKNRDSAKAKELTSEWKKLRQMYCLFKMLSVPRYRRRVCGLQVTGILGISGVTQYTAGSSERMYLLYWLSAALLVAPIGW